MKLLTLNCHSWQEDEQIEKIKYIAQTIQEKGYDVIALQEASQSIQAPAVFGNNKADNFALLLLQELEKLGVTGYHHVWDFAHIGWDIYEEGLAILTKHPIVETESFFISKSNDISYYKTRKIIGAKIRYNNRIIPFYSCHLGWWADEDEPFSYQVDVLMEHTAHHELFFLMGDFNNNAFLRGEGYDYLLSKGLYDTHSLAKEKDSGVTVKGKIAGWDENKHDLRLDLILANQPVTVHTSRVIFNGENNAVVSDHFGVEVEIEIKG
ncbi:MAG: endonuclease/exonuclease/phosphatase family protein [Ectobacillus sp.]